jgi:nitrile hydratase
MDPAPLSGASMDPAPSREIADMAGSAALPRRNGELVFDEAWQGRIFGLTVAMSHETRFVWREFQARLIDEIAHAEREGDASSYYERWLHAFEALLADKGLLDQGALAERTHDFETGCRDDVY